MPKKEAEEHAEPAEKKETKKEVKSTPADELKQIAAGLRVLITPTHSSPESYEHAQKLSAYAAKLDELAEEL
jgi:hypothetical protein